MLAVIKVTVRDVISKTSLTIYLSWWVLWLLISTLNPYRLYSVSPNVYLLLVLNVLMFSFGFILYGIINTKHKQIKYISNTFNSSIIDNNIFKIVLILFIVIVFYFFYKYLYVIQLLGGAGGRATLFEISDLFNNKYEIYLFNLIITPFSEYLIIVLISMMLFKRKVILFLLCLLFIITYGYIGSGRGYYISILMSLGFVFIIKPKIIEMNLFSIGVKKSTLSKVMIRNVIVTIVVVLIVLMSSFITAQRMGYYEINSDTIFEGLKEFGKQSILYMTGPFRALDYAITYNYAENIGLFYGRATFAGFEDLVKIIIHGFGGKYESANDVIIPLLQNNYILVSPDIYFNFAYTNVMIHLFDFGLIGVFVFPFLFGFIVRNMYYKYLDAPTFPMFVIIVYIFKTMILTVFKWQYEYGNTIILIFVLYLMHKSATKNSRGIMENVKDVCTKRCQQ